MLRFSMSLIALLLMGVAASPQNLPDQPFGADIQRLISHLQSHWVIPRGVRESIRLRIQLGRDGRLLRRPSITAVDGGSVSKPAAQSAIMAVYKAQPFTMLKPGDYERWKDLEIRFDLSSP
jgi:hypothetical protein